MRDRSGSSPALALAAMLLGSCSGTDTDTTPPADPQWWTTCGDPVCNTYSGPFDGVPICAEEVEGEPCTDDGAQCDLQNDCNVFLRCSVADPKGGEYGCPISLAAAKKDINYLDEALKLRLATWRYRTEADDAPVHLGFVIDDRPSSPAVAADGGHVDLYAYTSLAIAAIQVQQAEIDALRAEIDALRKELQANGSGRRLRPSTRR